MDERSVAECKDLQANFPVDAYFPITGQTTIIPTWPATKILHLRRHEPEVFARADKYLLLKDYVQYRLTGILCGEHSIYNFSFYFDIIRRKYWPDMLDFIGIRPDQLPLLVEPCTNIGKILVPVSERIGLPKDTTVNVGTLDHFAGMIGTGNIQEGLVSESTGTVMSLATHIGRPRFGDARIPCHVGPFRGTYILLSVCESGGVSLEWFKNNFMPDVSFKEIDETTSLRSTGDAPTFLPFLTGVNAPDYNPDASGVFYGLRIKHDRYDLAYAVMEGVAHLLKINMDFLKLAGMHSTSIISSGGGSKSVFWCQLKANLSGCSVFVPQSTEAACLGAAMIGAVGDGTFRSFDEAAAKCVRMVKRFDPVLSESLDTRHRLFLALYKSLSAVFSEFSPSRVNDN
jgi:xylulokinase